MQKSNVGKQRSRNILVQVNSLSNVPEVSACFVGPTVTRGALRAPRDCVKACISTEGLHRHMPGTFVSGSCLGPCSSNSVRPNR